MRIKTFSAFGLLLMFIQCGHLEIIKKIDDEIKQQECTGSVKILDKEDKELIVVSYKHPPEDRLSYAGKSRGGTAILDGNCCFEVRQKPIGKPGGSLLLKENKEYLVSFPVKYVIKSECVPGSGTSLIPIIITLAVLGVLAIIAVVVFMKKRSSRMTPDCSEP